MEAIRKLKNDRAGNFNYAKGNKNDASIDLDSIHAVQKNSQTRDLFQRKNGNHQIHPSES